MENIKVASDDKSKALTTTQMLRGVLDALVNGEKVVNNIKNLDLNKVINEIKAVKVKSKAGFDGSYTYTKSLLPIQYNLKKDDGEIQSYIYKFMNSNYKTEGYNDDKESKVGDSGLLENIKIVLNDMSGNDKTFLIFLLKAIGTDNSLKAAERLKMLTQAIINFIGIMSTWYEVSDLLETSSLIKPFSPEEIAEFSKPASAPEPEVLTQEEELELENIFA